MKVEGAHVAMLLWVAKTRHDAFATLKTSDIDDDDSVVMTYGLSAWYEPWLLMCGVVVDGKVDVVMDDVVVWMAEWRKQERERSRR